MSPRTGRPKSDYPKDVDVKVRIDQQTNQELLEYAHKNSLTRAEVIRKGIKMILGKEKK